MYKKDTEVLRDLCKQTMDVACQDVQDERRRLWTDFNSLKTRKVPVYVLDPQGIWREVFRGGDLKCEDALFRRYENWLRLQLYHASFGDDYVTEPWITVTPVYANAHPHWRTWGLNTVRERITDTLAYHLSESQIEAPEDFAKLIAPMPVIDEAATKEVFDIMGGAVGDIIRVTPDYMPPNIGNLASALAYMLGPERMFSQFYDQPDMVHALSKLISDTSMAIIDEAEARGCFGNCDSTFLNNALIQAMPYCHELPPPGPYRRVPAKEHWIYDCAQEFEGVGPDMYYEFMLKYEIPVYERFGLTAYGCCEGLAKKIPYLKKITNLRRVAVTPWADAEECAAQLTDQYVISWRPHPAEMVTNGFDPGRIAGIIRRHKEIFEGYGCYWEINLKDFITVEHDATRLKQWVDAVRAALGQA